MLFLFLFYPVALTYRLSFIHQIRIYSFRALCCSRTKVNTSKPTIHYPKIVGIFATSRKTHMPCFLSVSMIIPIMYTTRCFQFLQIALESLLKVSNESSPLSFASLPLSLSTFDFKFSIVDHHGLGLKLRI